MEKKEIPKLGRQDWLAIGLQIFIEKGIAAVRVDPLAKLLNVTRGSFYWHFKNRDDLLEAILREWEINKTDSIIERVEAVDSNPTDKLLSLFEIAAQDDDRLEKAIRIWAANDTNAAVVIERVDQRRLDYLRNLFLQIGFSRTNANVRAQVAYSVRLGWFMMASSSEPSGRLAEILLIHKFLTQRNKL